MTGASNTRDRAGRSYWDRNWAAHPEHELSDPSRPGLLNYVPRRFSKLFQSVFDGEGLNGRKVALLEVGCAQSIWLPYFRRELGCEITGIDYSDAGCRSARDLLAAAGVDGTVICTDLYAPPEHLLERFDVVFSNGLVEHFDDTAVCIRALARFLKPGGVMMTSIPNMSGGLGWLQKHLNRAVFDVHVPLDASALCRAHEESGLRVQHCEYFLFANSGILNVGDRGGVARGALSKIFLAATLAAWVVDGETGRLPVNRLTSPYVFCVARKP